MSRMFPIQRRIDSKRINPAVSYLPSGDHQMNIQLKLLQSRIKLILSHLLSATEARGTYDPAPNKPSQGKGH